MTTQPLLAADGLAMLRGERTLFRGVTVRLPPGGAVRLTGANGSGKTTLLRVLAGLTRPEAGSITRLAAHHWIGHRDGLKPHETPLAHLRAWAQAWGAPKPTDAFLASWGLGSAANIPARDLSAGQRRRTALARLDLIERPIWLLDEPFNALDGDAEARLARRIAEHRTKGGGVICAVHGEVPVADSAEVRL